MTPAELAAIRSRIEAASPGPWRRDRNNRAKIRDSYGDTIARIVHESNEEGFDAQCEADAAFIVSARSDILALLAHIEAVETDRDELRAKLAEAEATLARVHTACAAVDARMKNLHKYAATGAEDAIADVRAALADRGSDAR